MAMERGRGSKLGMRRCRAVDPKKQGQGEWNQRNSGRPDLDMCARLELQCHDRLQTTEEVRGPRPRTLYAQGV